MAQATILDSVTNITGTMVYPTISAGTNRKALLFLCYYSGAVDVTMPTSVTIGGVTPTIEEGLGLGQSNPKAGTLILSLNEAQIAAMVGSAVVTTGGSFGERLVIAASNNIVRQDAVTSKGKIFTGGSGTTSGTIPNLGRVAESWTLFVVTVALLADATMTNPSRSTTVTGTNFRVSIGYANDTLRTVDASYTIGASTRHYGVAINFEPAPSYLIDSVNGGVNTVKIGASTPITVSGFGGAVDAGTIDGFALSAASNTSVTIPFFTDGVATVRVGSSKTLVVTYTAGSQSADKVVDVVEADDWDFATLASGFNTGEDDSVVFGFSPAAAIGDEIWFDPTNGTVGTDAGYSGSFTGTQTLWHIQNSTGIARSYDLITGDGEIISGGLTTRGLTVSGLTVRGLTVTGL